MLRSIVLLWLYFLNLTTPISDSYLKVGFVKKSSLRELLWPLWVHGRKTWLQSQSWPASVARKDLPAAKTAGVWGKLFQCYYRYGKNASCLSADAVVARDRHSTEVIAQRSQLHDFLKKHPVTTIVSSCSSLLDNASNWWIVDGGDSLSLKLFNF